jgi:protocatechuate 4,5-dioxygenase alpha chain
MTDMTWPEYRQMMLDGGRSPEGNRSIKENLAAAARAQETGKDN